MRACASTAAGTLALLALILFAAFSCAASWLRIGAVLAAVSLVVVGTCRLSNGEE